MIDGSEKRNRQLAFELQNSHVCEKRSNVPANILAKQFNSFLYIWVVTCILKNPACTALFFLIPSPSDILLGRKTDQSQFGIPCSRSGHSLWFFIIILINNNNNNNNIIIIIIIIITIVIIIPFVGKRLF